jgi:tRNA-binding protein
MPIISYEDFEKVSINVGTILYAKENNTLKKPSIILTIDFGEKIGIKKSSALLQENYNCDALINRQVLAVINFMPKQIGKMISEVLVLGLPDHKKEAILITPMTKIKNGEKIY